MTDAKSRATENKSAEDRLVEIITTYCWVDDSERPRKHFLPVRSFGELAQAIFKALPELGYYRVEDMEVNKEKVFEAIGEAFINTIRSGSNLSSTQEIVKAIYRANPIKVKE